MKTLIFKKAQLFSIDGLISIFFCIVMILFIMSLWNLYALRLNENLDSEEMQLLSFQITDVLMKYEGSPSNWQNNPENVSIIGLRDETGKLDEQKLNTFIQMNYTEVKQILNIERFEYQMKIRDANGNLINSSGINASINAEQVVSTVRLSLIGNITRQIELTLWK